jgi:hypothetical protein
VGGLAPIGYWLPCGEYTRRICSLAASQWNVANNADLVENTEHGCTTGAWRAPWWPIKGQGGGGGALQKIKNDEAKSKATYIVKKKAVTCFISLLFLILKKNPWICFNRVFGLSRGLPKKKKKGRAGRLFLRGIAFLAYFIKTCCTSF